MPCRSGRQLLADAAADDGVALNGLAPDAVGRLVKGLARRVGPLARALHAPEINAAIAFAETPGFAGAGAAGLNAAVTSIPVLSDDACTSATSASQMGARAGAAPLLAAAADGARDAQPAKSSHIGSNDSEWAEWLRGHGMLPTRLHVLPQFGWLPRALTTPPLPPPPPPPPLLRPTPLYAFPRLDGGLDATAATAAFAQWSRDEFPPTQQLTVRRDVPLAWPPQPPPPLPLPRALLAVYPVLSPAAATEPVTGFRTLPPHPPPRRSLPNQGGPDLPSTILRNAGRRSSRGRARDLARARHSRAAPAT